MKDYGLDVEVMISKKWLLENPLNKETIRLINRFLLGNSLSLEEYQFLLGQIQKNAQYELSFSQKFIPLQKDMLLRLKSYFYQFGDENHQDMAHAYDQVRIGVCNYHDNYDEVLKGVYLTSNFLHPNNVKTLLNQRSFALMYKKKYGDYLSTWFSQQYFSQRKGDAECLSFDEREMKYCREKVLDYSLQYVKNRSN